MERKIEVLPHWTLQDTVTEAHQVRCTWTFVMHTLTLLIKVETLGYFGTLEPSPGCAYAELLVILSIDHENFQVNIKSPFAFRKIYPNVVVFIFSCHACPHS